MALIDEITYSPPLCIRCGKNPRRRFARICLECTKAGEVERQAAIVAREQQDGAWDAMARKQASMQAAPPAPGQPGGACSYCGTHAWVNLSGAWGCRSCGRSPSA
jgi:hypothetical protein